MIDWQEKQNDAIIVLAAAMKRGLQIKPNSQKQQDIYSKGIYALEVVATQLDLLMEKRDKK